MENSNLNGRILMELESLISRSCTNQKRPKFVQELHVALLKKCYNAADVTIDYHRKRVVMDIVMDDHCYDPKKVNLSLPLLRANLFYRSLADFLKSCILKDRKSLAFYAQLIQSFKNEPTRLAVI
ncbi:hypothetical protein U1E44_15855 [Arenibacter sp. GZD96]|uniref:hypothetical protein n=1 Tax=Aurantibrevibacter litoralis TaxID=3106030 RepID=UPI002AFE1580|nr:hypothetical protein [Arenibacter sp. GZD-96]MEA1787577.1 hypothetical protein [Arenibacter sp. GZD-96]